MSLSDADRTAITIGSAYAIHKSSESNEILLILNNPVNPVH